MLRRPRSLPMVGERGELLGEEGREPFPVEAEQILGLHDGARAASRFQRGGSPGRAHSALIAYADEAWQQASTRRSLLPRPTRNGLLGAGTDWPHLDPCGRVMLAE